MSPLLGWRIWRIRDDCRLESLAWDGSIWEPRAAVVASCATEGEMHEAPSLRCSCGVYAATDPWWTIRYSMLFAQPAIIGLMAGWGTIIEHAHGFRAAKGYPHRLYVPRRLFDVDHPGTAERTACYLEHIYGVPTLAVEHFEDAVVQHALYEQGLRVPA